MTDDLQLDGPTVTMFGERDALDTAVSDELGRRGYSTHTVTTAVGWLGSVTHAVIRLDTAVGQRAIGDLMAREAPSAHVVAVCTTPPDDAASARLDELCRRCGEHHDVSLVWHAPLEVGLDAAVDPSVAPIPAELAVAIADEIGHQKTQAAAPSFTSRVFEPQEA